MPAPLAAWAIRWTKAEDRGLFLGDIFFLDKGVAARKFQFGEDSIDVTVAGDRGIGWFTPSAHYLRHVGRGQFFKGASSAESVGTFWLR
jgi:hypothetical protein